MKIKKQYFTKRMNNFPLTALPDDMVIEILTRAQPEDIARIFATGAGFRRQYYDPELRQTVAEARKIVMGEKDAIIEEAKILVAQTDLTILSVGAIAVSGELANLFGNSFPKYRGETIVTRDILTKWFAIYINLNNLPLQGGGYFMVDKNLADLSGRLNWIEGSTLSFAQIQRLIVVNTTKTYLDTIPDDILHHLAFVKNFMDISLRRISEKRTGEEKERRRMARTKVTVPTATLLAEQQKKQQYLDMMKRTRLLSPRGY